MIVTEFYITRTDGVNLCRTYSDTGRFIRQEHTGNVYEEAVDIVSSGYVYCETDELIPFQND